MNVIVNGNSEEIPQSYTVRDLLEARGLGRSACAVEINRELVTRSLHQTRVVQPDDVVEIVSLVGGG